MSRWPPACWPSAVSPWPPSVSGCLCRQPADSSDSVSDTRPVEQKVSDQPDERKTTTTTTAATTSAATTTTAPAADLYVLPLGNTLQQPYSGTELLYSVTMQDWRTHEGADFAGEQGQAVKALADGRVTAVESDVFWGERVTIDHGTGVQSTYCGLKPTVKAGDTRQGRRDHRYAHCHPV